MRRKAREPGYSSGDSTHENKSRHIVNVSNLYTSPFNFDCLTVLVSDIFNVPFDPWYSMNTLNAVATPMSSAYQTFTFGIPQTPLAHCQVTPQTPSSWTTRILEQFEDNKIIIEDITAKVVKQNVLKN